VPTEGIPSRCLLRKPINISFYSETKEKLPSLGGFITKKNALIVVMRASCGRTTPFGSPVDPDVYIIIAGSRRPVFTDSQL